MGCTNADKLMILNSSFHLLFQLKKTNKPTDFCPGLFLIAEEKTSTSSLRRSGNIQKNF